MADGPKKLAALLHGLGLLAHVRDDHRPGYDDCSSQCCRQARAWAAALEKMEPVHWICERPYECAGSCCGFSDDTEDHAVDCKLNRVPLYEFPDEPKVGDTTYGDCGHSFDRNRHGFDQNDGRLDENGTLIHRGRCSYCKICRSGR